MVYASDKKTAPRWDKIRKEMLPRHSGEERSTIRKPMAKNYIGETTRGVTYLDDLLRKNHQVTFGEEKDENGNEIFEEDIFYVGQGENKKRANTSSMGHNPTDLWWGNPNDVSNTDPLSAVQDPNFMYAYVLDLNDNIYIGKHQINAFHHSSFMSGRPVKDAGMLHIINGVLIGLSTKSGHYKPVIEQKIFFLKKLYDRVPATKGNKGALGQLVVYDAFHQKYYSAEKLLSSFTKHKYTEDNGQLVKTEGIKAAEVSDTTAANMIRTRYEQYYEPYAKDMNFSRPSLPRKSKNRR